MKIKIVKNSEIPAFGAWCSESLKKDDGTILFNVEALMAEMVDAEGNPVEMTEDDRKRAFIEILMHEFGHALEEAFGFDHNELFVETAVSSFAGEKPSLGP